MCGFPTTCLEIQLLALVGLDVVVCICLELNVCPKKWMGLAVACLCHCSLPRMTLVVVTVIASEPIRNSTCYTWMQITFLSLKPNVNVTVNASNAHFSNCISARYHNTRAQVHFRLYPVHCTAVTVDLNSGLRKGGFDSTLVEWSLMWTPNKTISLLGCIHGPWGA